MYIAIEGCVGAGKSTVTRGLAKRRRSRVLLENFEINPFLQAFYQNPVEHALETEFSFLLLHYHQLKVEHGLGSDREIVADFHLGKDLLYASLNIRETRALVLFKELFELCSEIVPEPSLIVYLAAPTELLVQRIAQRNRNLEANVDEAYFANINEAYDQFFSRYQGPKLRIPMGEWDFVKDETLYQELSNLVDEKLAHK